MAEFGVAAPYALAQREYGGVLLGEETVVTVAATMTELAGGDPERVLLVFVNLSLNVVFLAPSIQVSTSRGIRLAPNGGFLSMNAREDGILQTLQWFAVTDVGSATVFRVTQRRTVAI